MSTAIQTLKGPATCSVETCTRSAWLTTDYCVSHLIDRINKSLAIDEIVEFWDRMDVLFRTFTYREREAYKLLHGFGDGYTYSIDEVARIFKVTPARVIAFEANVNRKFQHPVRLRQIDHLLLRFSIRKALLSSAVITPYARHKEGQLIRAVIEPWQDIIRFAVANPSALHQIGSRKWEEIIAGYYDLAGFDEIILTPRSGDQGRDIIAVKKGVGCVRFFEEVKAYNPNHRVTAQEVRALLGVLHGDPNTSKAIFTTTSDFAPRLERDPAIKNHMPYRLELINGKKLLSRLSDLARTLSR
jgi:restriction system protein